MVFQKNAETWQKSQKIVIRTQLKYWTKVLVGELALQFNIQFNLGTYILAITALKRTIGQSRTCAKFEVRDLF
jgi:hypothetical protein